MNKTFLILLLSIFTYSASAQTAIDEDQLGAWYMYFYSMKFKESQFGMQGDFQYRAWNMASDKEQLLLRSGFTYSPREANITFTLGYAYISTGAFGESSANVLENRIYQEALLPQKVGGRFYLTHRFRFEQRWVEGQDFRTRFRYNIFMNIPLNKPSLQKDAVYLALYNEIFINGQKNVNAGSSVELFDRNRTYLGLGYGLRDNLRVQAGWMKQTTNSWAKGQLQFSLHHSF
ncbi:DUF2490 domain-containing protein [Algoriphagus halophytocola]|uniref:DUF2490 domain-containing protein n=1 Tax=Algoriphagus halophytocola TaxID=2991499 RepID=A0ABY6MK61_9BACT|nr:MULTISPECIES: DUF2490 domain-containing protein [unclassified Algoriphagus]UZD23563.1 DUF2490 domain-containing protein [Algoriphagus sp. TR-M5]WBL44857.1 DUF2490 domain-containing protein [Algoriphagus sp. TR-M9]